MSPTVPVAKQTQKQAQKKSAVTLNAAEHHDRIAKAAYFHAEHRGFNGGDPVADWLAAEADIKSTFNKS